MLLFYVLCGIDTASVLSLIGGTALIAGTCEAIAAAVLCTPFDGAAPDQGPELKHGFGKGIPPAGILSLFPRAEDHWEADP